jgi:energy-coupling factor transporter transmembrane protein EcfT
VTQARGARLKGAPRFIAYFALQVAVFSLGLRWLAVSAVIVVALGMADGLHWGHWLGRSRWLALVALLPAITGFPWAGGIGMGTAAGFWAAWEPSLVRSVRLGLVLASAAWLSSNMSPVELRDALSAILRPLGQKAAGRIARAASLTMAFIPWTGQELRLADDAALLRGSDPRRHPGRHLAAVSVPLVARSLEKARRAAEALSLRDPRFGG